ncbi:MAG: hypothetical protein WCY26_02040 [Thiohalobacteraceae bacterium]|nr:hypothetical protein [Gammaproteobacteria bacterium]
MDLQNLAYALTQVAHNFGAVAVVGGAVYGGWPRPEPLARPRSTIRLVLAGWLLQVVSGAGFGTISFAYYGQFPDLHGIAVVALLIKIVCAALGITLAIVMLRTQRTRLDRRQGVAWAEQALLGVTALTAAAFLRWFS